MDLDEITAARIRMAMQMVSASLAELSNATDDDPAVLAEFPAEAAFFNLAQRRAERVFAAVGTLKKRIDTDSIRTHVDDLAKQTVVDFAVWIDTSTEEIRQQAANVEAGFELEAAKLLAHMLQHPRTT